MTNATRPISQVLLDDGTGTFPYDITAKGTAYEIKRGRQDEANAIEASSLTLELDNTDGSFTLGSVTYGADVDQAIQVIESMLPVNLMTAAQSSFESGIGTWSAGGSVPPTLSNPSTHPVDGAKALLITWGTGGTLPQAGTSVGGFKVGQTYTASLYVWVPSGSPDVAVAVAGIGVGAATSTKDASVRISLTFVATATTHLVQVWPASAPSAGQQCYADAGMVNKGDTAGTFNLDAPSPRFTGYVDEWPVEWPDGTDLYATCTVTARDRRPRLDGHDLRSMVEEEILLDEPTLYYTLAEPTGATSAGDTSGNAAASLTAGGAGAPVAFGSGIGPSNDGLTAAMFAGGQFLSSPGVSYASDEQLTLECWFATTTADAVLVRYAGWYLELSAGRVAAVGPGAFFGSLGSGATFNDGALHHLAFRYGSTISGGGSFGVQLLVDGVGVNVNGAGSPSPASSGPVEVGGDVGGLTVSGSVSHVCHFAACLDPADIARHYAAGTTGFAGESSNARVARLATYAGLAPGDLNLETGILTQTAAQSTNGATAGAAIDEVVKAEGGVLFIAGDGRLTMQNRDHRVYAATGAAKLAIDSADADPPTVAGDKKYVINYAPGSRVGGADQLGSDQTSIAKRGREVPTSELTGLLVTTDREVLVRLNWEVQRHKGVPLVKPRITSVTLDLSSLPTAVGTAFLALELGDRLTIANMPSQAPWSTADLLVEGMTEHFSEGKSGGWSVTFNTVPAELFHAWILGDATYGVLGSTTIPMF